MTKKYLTLILVIFLFNCPVYSAGTKTDTDVGKGGSEDYSFLKAKNSNFIKATKAIKQAKKYDKKGKSEKAKKRFNDAIKFLTIANNETPNEPDILNYLGYSLRKIGDFTMAEIYHEQGLTINPKHIGINEYLGELYVETNRIDKAKERLKVLENCKCEEFEKLRYLIFKYWFNINYKYYKKTLIEEFIILSQIIFIDIILAADNAIIIGLIAANFVPKNRKQIILWGVAGALVFKVIFALFATYLFEFYYIKILGGFLLIWIVNDLRKDLVEMKNKIKSPIKKSTEPSFVKSIYKVLFADITISFDNVIGVVGAAKGYFGFMIFGLILSVVLTGALATYLANYIQKNLWIAYVGLGFILIVAIQLIIGGLNDYGVLSINETFKQYF